MLSEAVTWLLTPCTSAARRFGYLREAIAFASRAGRCRAAWKEHVAQCRLTVAASLAQCDSYRTALVLGSGLAAEFPLDELSGTFERVVLVDMVHLPELRRRSRKLRNVELLSYDLSGVVAALDDNLSSVAGNLDNLAAATAIPTVDGVDWALSCNLLSQLPILPVAWLRKHCPQIGDERLEAFGRHILQRHLDAFVALPAERCLIADGEQHLYDRNGVLAERADYRSALGLGCHVYAEWDWQMAPPGELPDGYSAIHKVIACRWPYTGKPITPHSQEAAPAGCA